MADDRHVAPLLLVRELRRRLLAVHRGRVDVQGRRLSMVQRDRQQPAVRQRQGVQRAPRRAVASQPAAQGIVARQLLAAEQLHQRPLEMRVEPELADQLGERRQAASRRQFVFRGRNLAGLDVHKALLRSGPPSG